MIGACAHGCSLWPIRSTLVSAGNTNWIDDSGDLVKEPLLDVSNTAVFHPALVPPSSGGGGPPPGTGVWNLSYSTTTTKRNRKVNLVWSSAAAASTTVDIWRTVSLTSTVTNTANDGAFTDTIPKTGTYYYFVCEAGNDQNCSDFVTVG